MTNVDLRYAEPPGLSPNPVPVEVDDRLLSVRDPCLSQRGQRDTGPFPVLLTPDSCRAKGALDAAVGGSLQLDGWAEHNWEGGKPSSYRLR